MIDRDISPEFRRRVPDIILRDPPQAGDYYALILAEYVPDGAARFGPDHHILVDVWDAEGNREFGTPVHFTYPQAPPVSEVVNKRGVPYGADHALFNAGHVVGVWVGTDPMLSDYAGGMGLGKIGAEQEGDHVTYFLIFQRQKFYGPGPDPDPKPGPNIEAALTEIKAAKALIETAITRLAG